MTKAVWILSLRWIQPLSFFAHSWEKEDEATFKRIKSKEGFRRKGEIFFILLIADHTFSETERCLVLCMSAYSYRCVKYVLGIKRNVFFSFLVDLLREYAVILQLLKIREYSFSPMHYLIICRHVSSSKRGSSAKKRFVHFYT